MTASFRTGPMLLADHTKALLGGQSSRRSVRIMVTMPSEAAYEGPHIAEAVRFLHGVLTHMESHQSKKTAMLRKLSISEVR